MFLFVHFTGNLIHNYYTKGKFCLPYSTYTKVLLILKRSTDALHKGDVDSKELLGFELAAQIKQHCLSQHFSTR